MSDGASRTSPPTPSWRRVGASTSPSSSSTATCTTGSGWTSSGCGRRWADRPSAADLLGLLEPLPLSDERLLGLARETLVATRASTHEPGLELRDGLAQADHER